MKKYNLVFRGEILKGFDPEAVQTKIAKIFKADISSIERLFNGKPVAVRKAVNADTAARFRQAFLDSGAKLHIQPISDDTPASPSSEPRTQTSEPKLLPANTGSLIEFAKAVDAQPIADISNLSISAPGTTIDIKPRAAKVTISTEHLSVSSAGTGSLEDCKKDIKKQAIADISHLSCETP